MISSLLLMPFFSLVNERKSAKEMYSFILKTHVIKVAQPFPLNRFRGPTCSCVRQQVYSVPHKRTESMLVAVTFFN